MGAAGEIALVESRSGKQTSHRHDMLRIAAMGRASDRKLVLAKSESIGAPALHERNGLQRLDGRAREYRTLHVAEREQEAAVGVSDSDCARVSALDDGPSDDLDEHGIA
jgi:hypothetical protein